MPSSRLSTCAGVSPPRRSPTSARSRFACARSPDAARSRGGRISCSCWGIGTAPVRFPSAIEGDSFRRVHVRLSEDDARIVDRWYLEDRNAVPSVFVLQPRRGPYQASDVWDEEERRVRSALLRAAAERQAEEAVLSLLRTSITEQESVRGIPEDAVLPGAAFVFWRRIDGMPEDAAADPYRNLVDGEPDQDALDSLWIFRRGLRRRLGDEAISEYQAAWDTESGRPTTSRCSTACARTRTRSWPG